MRSEAEYSLVKFEKAFLRMKEGVEQAKDELEEDGVIQRFEFTFEAFWKALKILLSEKGINTLAPRDAFKAGFKLEWLDDEEVFLNMLRDRNKTSHIYDEKTSRKIFSRIKDDYVNAIGIALNKLKAAVD